MIFCGDDFFSSRPHTAMLAEEASADKNLTLASPQKPRMLSEVAPKLPSQTTPQHAQAADVSATVVTSLVYHSTDFAVSPISEDIKVIHKLMNIFFLCFWFLVFKVTPATTSFNWIAV